MAKLAPTASSIPPAWRCTICTAFRARFTGYSGSGGGCAADLVHDKNLLLLHHQVTTSCCCAIRWSTILALQRSGLYPALQPALQRAAAGLDGSWRIKQHLFDQHHGALFPLVDAFRSRSGPDAEDYQWLMHQARPALSVDEARLDGYWLRIDSLQSNALVLYEFTPQLSSGADPAPEVNREFSAGSPSLPD